MPSCFDHQSASRRSNSFCTCETYGREVAFLAAQLLLERGERGLAHLELLRGDVLVGVEPRLAQVELALAPVEILELGDHGLLADAEAPLLRLELILQRDDELLGLLELRLALLHRALALVELELRGGDVVLGRRVRLGPAHVGLGPAHLGLAGGEVELALVELGGQRAVGLGHGDEVLVPELLAGDELRLARRQLRPRAPGSRPAG